MNNIDKLRAANARITALEAQLREYDDENTRLEIEKRNLEAQLAEANARAEADGAAIRNQWSRLECQHDLAIQRAEAAEAREGRLREFAGKLWERLNSRRCYLIERNHAGRTPAAERLELDELQKLADENIRIFAPLPIDALEEYMRERGIETPEQPAESEADSEN